MATELTQEEQEYQDEFNKAFYGENNVPRVEDDEEEESKEPETEAVPAPGEDEAVEENTDDVENGVAEDGASDTVSDDAPADTDEVEEPLSKLIWNGKEIMVTDAEKTALAQKGFDYTSKTKFLAENKKQFEILDKNKISLQELEIFAKAKAGDKEALAYLIQSGGVDTVDLLDVEPANVVLHNAQQETVISQQVAPLLAEVESNPELLAVMHSAVSRLPKTVTDAMQQSPDWFRAVHAEVTNGNFEIVIPKVQLKLAQMSNVDRAYFETNAQAFADLYTEVSTSGVRQPAVVPPVKTTEKPNMAEVGVKRNSGADRREEVKADAFTDDKTYQAILNRMRRTIG